MCIRDRTVAWWFGGGFDLTPFYPVDEDVLHWHRTARALCEPFGGQAPYDAHKRWCDEYFFLKHRGETDVYKRQRSRSPAGWRKNVGSPTSASPARGRSWC